MRPSAGRGANPGCALEIIGSGTAETAKEVTELLSVTDDPGRTAIGLKNHGITVTGGLPEDVFSGLRGKSITEVPAFA